MHRCRARVESGSNPKPSARGSKSVTVKERIIILRSFASHASRKHCTAGITFALPHAGDVPALNTRSRERRSHLALRWGKWLSVLVQLGLPCLCGKPKVFYHRHCALGRQGGRGHPDYCFRLLGACFGVGQGHHDYCFGLLGACFGVGQGHHGYCFGLLGACFGVGQGHQDYCSGLLGACFGVGQGHHDYCFGVLHGRFGVGQEYRLYCFGLLGACFGVRQGHYGYCSGLLYGRFGVGEEYHGYCFGLLRACFEAVACTLGL